MMREEREQDMMSLADAFSLSPTHSSSSKMIFKKNSSSRCFDVLVTVGVESDAVDFQGLSTCL
jgi:hypothetical protein